MFFIPKVLPMIGRLSGPIPNWSPLTFVKLPGTGTGTTPTGYFRRSDSASQPRLSETDHRVRVNSADGDSLTAPRLHQDCTRAREPALATIPAPSCPVRRIERIASGTGFTLVLIELRDRRGPIGALYRSPIGV